MDLGVLLESPQGSQSSSRVGACTWAFLPSCSSSVALPFAWIKGSSGCGRNSRASSGVETGVSGNFLSCSKGVKDPLNFQMLVVISLETPQRKWASSRLEGRTSWIFSICGRSSGLKTETSGTSSGDLRKSQSPCEFLGCLSGFLFRRCRGLRPCVESVPEPEDSSPVLTWSWGTSGVSPGVSVLVSSGGRHVRFPPEL